MSAAPSPSPAGSRSGAAPSPAPLAETSAPAPPLDPATASDEDTARRRPRGKALRPLRGLLPFVFRYKGTVLAAFFALVLSTGVMLSLPMAARAVIDNGFSRESAEAIDRYFLVLLGVALLAGVTSSLRFYLVSWIGERVVADLRAAVFDHVIAQSPGFFERNHTGEIQARLTTDTTLIKSVVGSTASIALRNAFTLVGSVSLLVYTSPPLAGLVLVAIPVILLPLIGFGRWVRRLSRRSQDTLADTNVFAGEALGFVQTVQAYTHEDLDRDRYRSVVEVAFEAARARMLGRALLTAAVIFLVFAFIVGIVWMGAQNVIAGTMSTGELSQFVFYAMFASMALAAVTEVWGDLQLAAGAAERLFELLGVEPEIAAPSRPVALPEPPQGRIEFDAVDFRYPTRPEVVALSTVAFRAEPGETIAIVGPSGAGKSTLFRLLLRFYDPSAGVIRVDGVDVRETDPRTLRSRMAIVPQETAIFTASLRENIRYGRPDATDADVEAAAAIARVDAFARELPRGFDTRLGENGMTLSGGQRQRVAIARAVLKDAPILLLDEATSALDSQSERLVQAAIEQLKSGRTTIVIAHRLATVRDADRIVVLDHGRVDAIGRHDALLAEGGLYADLARMQLAGERGDATDARLD